MEDLLHEFLIETNESLESVDVQLVRLEQEPTNAEVLAGIFRLVHTIKGTCGFVGLPRLEALAHAAESLMGRFREGAPVTPQAITLILTAIDAIRNILSALNAEQREPEGDDADLIRMLECMALGMSDGATRAEEISPAPRRHRAATEHRIASGGHDIDTAVNEARLFARGEDFPASLAGSAENAAPTLRVNVSTLERLMTIVSELVLTRNQLLEVMRPLADGEVKTSLHRLSLVTSDLQESIMKTRMQPIGNAWQKLPRIVRDLAGELHKEIEFQMLGGDTELDRQVLELIRDPLTHLVRNSADHGLETPAERYASGKPGRGVIRLAARHEGGHILVELADDGRGLDTERILAKAIAAGLVSAAEAQRLSEAQIHRLIFTPGFSTLSGVTGISGRGVGLDVVRNNLEKIGGAVDVKSVPGAGACFTLKIPLTLAIVSSLIVGCGGQRYAIPQLAITELLRARVGAKSAVELIAGTSLIRLRGRLVPIIHLSDIGTGAQPARDSIEGYIVVVQSGGRRFGIVVDTLFQTEEIVVKPLSARLRETRVFSGNTIVGDGAVILIIDPNGLSEVFGLAGGVLAGSDEIEPAPQVEEKTALLLFRAGGPGQKAVPLTSVARLEEVSASAIETSNGREVVQYRGKLMPIMRWRGQVPSPPRAKQSLLVFSDAGIFVALAVDQIIDVAHETLTIELPEREGGLVGTAVVRGVATEIIDVGHLLAEALEGRAQRSGQAA